MGLPVNTQYPNQRKDSVAIGYFGPPRFSDALRGGNDFLSVALLVYGPAVIVSVRGLKSNGFVANQTQVFSIAGAAVVSMDSAHRLTPPGWAVRKALHILWGRTKAQVLAPKCAKRKCPNPCQSWGKCGL